MSQDKHKKDRLQKFDRELVFEGNNKVE